MAGCVENYCVVMNRAGAIPVIQQVAIPSLPVIQQAVPAIFEVPKLGSLLATTFAPIDASAVRA